MAELTHLPVQKRMLRVRPSSNVCAQRPSRSAHTRRSLLRWYSRWCLQQRLAKMVRACCGTLWL